MNDVTTLITQPLFYAQIVGCLALWYAASCIIALKLFNAGGDPFSASRRGVWWGLVISLLFIGLGFWFLTAKFMLTVALLVATLLIAVALIFTLQRLEPVVERSSGAS